MYIHIGWNQVIFMDDIISIVAVPNTDPYRDKKHPAHYCKTRRTVEVKPGEIPRTYIITKDITYISPVSIKTIAKRIDNVYKNI